jgi:HEAT repeat protein
MVKIHADPTATVPALTKLLSDSDPEVRAHAAMGLAACGPAASPALPALETMRQYAEERLAAISNAAIESIKTGTD